MQSILRRDFRASPRYELVLFDRLSAGRAGDAGGAAQGPRFLRRAPAPRGLGRARRQVGRPRHGPALPDPARAGAAARVRRGDARGRRLAHRGAAGGGRRAGESGKETVSSPARRRSRCSGKRAASPPGGRPAGRALPGGPALRPGARDRRSPAAVLAPLRLQPPAAHAALAAAAAVGRGRGAAPGHRAGREEPPGPRPELAARQAIRRVLADLARPLRPTPSGDAARQGREPVQALRQPRSGSRWQRASARSWRRSRRRAPSSSRSEPTPPASCGRTRSWPTSRTSSASPRPPGASGTASPASRRRACRSPPRSRATACSPGASIRRRPSGLPWWAAGRAGASGSPTGWPWPWWPPGRREAARALAVRPRPRAPRRGGHRDLDARGPALAERESASRDGDHRSPGPPRRRGPRARGRAAGGRPRPARLRGGGLCHHPPAPARALAHPRSGLGRAARRVPLAAPRSSRP